MHLFNYQGDEYLVCTSFEEEYPGQPGTDYVYYDAQVFKVKPTRRKAQLFYQFYVPALALLTGTMLSGRHEPVDFAEEN